MRRIDRTSLNPTETKIAMTILIDADVVLWFRKEADRSGIPCQTLLNFKLHEVMNQPTLEAQVKQNVEKILAR